MHLDITTSSNYHFYSRMRTTLSIDDDVLDAARAIAEQTRRSLGQVVSDLARKGLRPRKEFGSRGGLPVFKVSEKARPITPEAVRQALDDDE
jgi:hypothetical protein